MANFRKKRTERNRMKSKLKVALRRTECKMGDKGLTSWQIVIEDKKCYVYLNVLLLRSFCSCLFLQFGFCLFDEGTCAV